MFNIAQHSGKVYSTKQCIGIVTTPHIKEVFFLISTSKVRHANNFVLTLELILSIMTLGYIYMKYIYHGFKVFISNIRPENLKMYHIYIYIYIYITFLWAQLNDKISIKLRQERFDVCISVSHMYMHEIIMHVQRTILRF